MGKFSESLIGVCANSQAGHREHRKIKISLIFHRNFGIYEIDTVDHFPEKIRFISSSVCLKCPIFLNFPGFIGSTAIGLYSTKNDADAYQTVCLGTAIVI